MRTTGERVRTTDFLREHSRRRLMRMLDKIIHESNVAGGITSDHSGELHDDLVVLRGQMFMVAKFLGEVLQRDLDRFKGSGVKRDE